MRGRVSGRPTKWLRATIHEGVDMGKAGIQFEVWQKWKKRDKKLGTLTVSVGGLRWLTSHGKKEHRRTWDEVSAFFDG